MTNIVLTVQPCGNGKFRLGLSLNDSRSYFKKRKQQVLIIVGTRVFNTQTTCGSDKKGYDLYSTEINEWIIENNYHKYPRHKPTKLEFELDVISDKIKLTLKRKID
ncbi:MAG TPA: hypothetical protein VK476_02195 [Flavobacterium sp.]|nr:hypothetical protein [Flavobacterium sp.]